MCSLHSLITSIHGHKKFNKCVVWLFSWTKTGWLFHIKLLVGSTNYRRLLHRDHSTTVIQQTVLYHTARLLGHTSYCHYVLCMSTWCRLPHCHWTHLSWMLLLSSSLDKMTSLMFMKLDLMLPLLYQMIMFPPISMLGITLFLSVVWTVWDTVKLLVLL